MKNNLKLTVDFQGVASKQDVILRLAQTFYLHDISGNSWDSFEDYFTNLNTDSGLVQDVQPEITDVNLVVRNLEHVRLVSPEDHDILVSILGDATHIDNRGDGIHFSFEVERQPSGAS